MRHRYTDEEKTFVRQNIGRYSSYRTLANAFCAEFGVKVSPSSISDLCTKRMHIGIGHSSTKFKPGARTRAVPIGTIRKSQNGATYIKVSNQATGISGYSPPDWIPLQMKIWEDAYGQVPQGCMICFLDCDRENFSLNNLYCIDRKISAILAKNKWYSTNPQITLAGIKFAELHLQLQQE